MSLRSVLTTAGISLAVVVLYQKFGDRIPVVNSL